MFPLPLPSIPARFVAVAVVLVATFVTGLVWGLRLEGKRHADYIAQQATAAVAIVTKQGAVTERVVTRYVERQAKTQASAQAIQQQVQTYANAGACIDADWVRLHNAAALGSVPKPAP